VTSATEFARIARSLQVEATRLGLVAPAFRSPPHVDSDRTLRRHPSQVVISIRLDRDPHAIASDMIDGLVKAQPVNLGDTEAMVRHCLWEAAGVAVTGAAA